MVCCCGFPSSIRLINAIYSYIRSYTWELVIFAKISTAASSTWWNGDEKWLLKKFCRLTNWWLSQVLAEHMGCWGTEDDPLILEELLWADWWTDLGSWQLWCPEARWLSCRAPQPTERRGASSSQQCWQSSFTLVTFVGSLSHSKRCDVHRPTVHCQQR